jgi:hypothetical protein
MQPTIPLDEVALRLLCAMVSKGEPHSLTTVREAFALALNFHDHAALIRSRKGEPLAFDDNGV